jgi:putative ABC transport system substrate-binding protein
MSLTNSLRRAEAAGATLVVTYGSQATSLAKESLKDTPLLFSDVYDPVSLGVVKTLAAPGSDASGATSKTDLGLLIEALVAIKPVKTVGVLYTKGEKGSEKQLAEIKEQGKAFGFKVAAENARHPKEAQALGKKLTGETEALFLTESISVSLQASALINSAHGNKCIVFSQIPGMVEQGALIGLEADLDEQGKLVAVHALQAMQGKQVHLLPVREAKKVSLKINKKAAADLSLTIPAEVASKAKVM